MVHRQLGYRVNDQAVSQQYLLVTLRAFLHGSHHRLTCKDQVSIPWSAYTEDLVVSWVSGQFPEILAGRAPPATAPPCIGGSTPPPTGGGPKAAGSPPAAGGATAALPGRAAAAPAGTAAAPAAAPAGPTPASRCMSRPATARPRASCTEGGRSATCRCRTRSSSSPRQQRKARPRPSDLARRHRKIRADEALQEKGPV